MKKFLNIFIFIQVILLIYIFNSSVMNIYEKNNIINKSLHGYQINMDDLNQAEKFFDELMDKHKNYEFAVIKNTISTTDKSIYEIYTLPYESFMQKNTFSKNITYIYKPLEKADWIDSTGKFHTDVPKVKIEEVSKKYNLNVIEKDIDLIDYRQIIKLFSYNFAVLIIVTQIVYCIYISYNLKEIGIKLSMGFSTFKIFKEYLRYLVKIFILSIILIIMPYGVYLVLFNRFTILYITFIILYFFFALAINLLLFYNGFFIISLVDLDLMIKNKTFNKHSNILIQAVKIMFTFLIVFSNIALISEYTRYKEINTDIFRYKELNNFYTGNGYYSDEYDLMEVDKDKSMKYASSVKELYIQENGLFCDASYLSNYLDGRVGEENNFAIINRDYLNKFSNLSSIMPDLDLDSLPEDTVLISESLKPTQERVLNFLKSVVELSYNYMTGSDHKVSEFNIVYIPEAKIKVNTENGFQEINIPFVYLDKGDLNGAYYLDQFSNGNIIFESDSREQFIDKLESYNLGKVIGAGTLLTPYLISMGNAEFKLKTLSIFSILFAVTLAFIIYISNYISINVNKKKYAYKKIHGYSHLNILKSNYLVLGMLLIIGAVLSVIEFKLVTVVIIVLVDMFVFEVLYRTNINDKLYEIVKGA